MDQFIEEVQDEWRKDQLVKVWKKYGNLFITACVTAILMTVGYAVWDNHTKTKIASQTKAYEQALVLIDDKHNASAIKIFDELNNDGSLGYQILSKFKEINLSQNTDKKLKLLQSVVADNAVPKIYRNLASYYLMAIKFDITRTSDFIHELKDYLTAENQFYNYFLELKALGYYKLNQLDHVQEICQSILTHKEITPVMRLRIMALSNHIKNMK